MAQPRTVDVVVIGSGVAGLAAAYESASRGARVLVIDSNDSIGGASVMSGAACCIVGTPEQAALGVSDSVELALADWARFGGPTADLEWASIYLAASLVEVHDFCEEMGITWSAPQFAEGNSVQRWHLPDRFGPGIVEGILRRLEPLDVPVLTGVAATALIVDDGAVVGVRTSGGPGFDEVRAASVIVATGGFVNNREMLEEHDPVLASYPRYLNGGSPTARGTGHVLLAEAGASFASMGNIWVYPNGTPDPQDATGSRGIGLRGVTTEIWLNLEGRRFHDESLRGGFSGTNALVGQPEQSAWSVFRESDLPGILLIDNEYYARPAGPNEAAMAEFWATSPFTASAESPAELARLIGLEPDVVASSIGNFNDAIAIGTDPLTGRDLAGLAPLVGRLRAVRFFPMAQKNFGGARTDLSCRVLDPASAPVPGLYAVGEVAGMAGGSINGIAGLEGTMFGPALFSGRVAGRSVEF